MIQLSDVDRQRFEDDGFIIVSDPGLAPLWARVDAEISQLVQFFVGRPTDIYHHSLADVDEKMQSQIYDRLHYLPSLASLSSDQTILAYCQQLGLAMPILMGCCNMRYDRPENQKHLFKWHQDSVYLLGSVNAVTVWIPFSQVNRELGSVAVIPGSHKQGLRKFKVISHKAVNSGLPFLQRDIDLDEEVPVADEVIIEANRGDLVIFKQMLLHRSVFNTSNTVRWTAQLRISDLASDEYRLNGFKNGDKHNIFQVNFPGFQYE